MEPQDMDAVGSLAAAVHRHAVATPSALAVASAGRLLDYRQLAGQASRLAGYLAAAPGWAVPGHGNDRPERPRVGVLASRSADACIAVLGAAWAGATYVPLGPRLPDERLLAILSRCRLTAIVADAVGASRLDGRILHAAPPCVLALGSKPSDGATEERVQWIDTDAPWDRQTIPAPTPMVASDIAYIIFTSGTTGVPKGVMIPLRAARYYIRTITGMLGLAPSDRAMESCDLTFDFSVHNMFSTWEAGASLHLLPAARAMGAIRFARSNRLTVWNSVPSLAGLLRQVKALAPGVLPDLRLTVFGGEQLSWRTVQAWRAAAPQSAIWNLYGPTEATVFCMGLPLAGRAPMADGRDVIAIGTAFPGSEAAVLDPQGRPVADGIAGELAIAGVQLASGYLNAAEQTAARFPTIDGRRWYLTGDLARRDPDGSFQWLARVDNQVKLLGHRVELEDVDAHLRVVADADLVGTVAWPLADGDAQGLVAFYAGAVRDEAGIIATLKQRLPPYMIPSRVVRLDRMPLNGNGKVDRRALRQRLEEGLA